MATHAAGLIHRSNNEYCGSETQGGAHRSHSRAQKDQGTRFPPKQRLFGFECTANRHEKDSLARRQHFYQGQIFVVSLKKEAIMLHLSSFDQGKGIGQASSPLQDSNTQKFNSGTRIFQELIATIMICSSVHQSQLRSRAGTVSNGRGNEFLKDPRTT